MPRKLHHGVRHRSRRGRHRSRSGREKGYITVVRSKDENNHLALLFYAESYTPVLGELVFKGAIQPANPPFGGRVTAKSPHSKRLPTAPTSPSSASHPQSAPKDSHTTNEGTDNSCPTQPRGIALPNHCPHQGFVFSAHFTFQDGTQAHATSTSGAPPTNRANNSSESTTVRAAVRYRHRPFAHARTTGVRPRAQVCRYLTLWSIASEATCTVRRPTKQMREGPRDPAPPLF